MDPMERIWGLLRDGPKPDEPHKGESYSDRESVRRFWERVSEADRQIRAKKLGATAVDESETEDSS